MRTVKRMAKRLTQNKIELALAYLECKRATVTRRRNGRWILKQEARLTRRIKKRFDRQRDWLVERIRSMEIFNRETEASFEVKSYPEDIEIIVKELPELAKIVDDLVAYATLGWKRGARLAYNDLDMGDSGLDFNLSNEEALKYMEALTDLHLSDYRGSISRTTRKRIIKILTEAAETGASYQETAKKIIEQGKQGVFTRSRAEMIATNEIGKAYGEGNRRMIEDFVNRTGAIMQKQWITVGDDRVTEECLANEADDWLPFDGHFNSGDDAAPRSGHPRCRCDTGYREVDTNGEPI